MPRGTLSTFLPASMTIHNKDAYVEKKKTPFLCLCLCKDIALICCVQFWGGTEQCRHTKRLWENQRKPNTMHLVNGLTASILLGTTTTLVFQIFTQYMTLVNNVSKAIKHGEGFCFVFYLTSLRQRVVYCHNQM